MSIVAAIPQNSSFSSALTSAATTATASGSNTNFLNLKASTASSMDQIDKTSQDFEAVFLTQMLKPMFEGEASTSYFGGGTSGDIYRGFLLDAYGKSMAKAGGIGIAAQVKQQLLKLQEVKA